MNRSGVASFVLLLLLFLPPVLGVVLRQTDAPPTDAARLQALENEVAVLKRRQSAHQSEAQVVTAWGETHSAHIGRILPVEDVSPQRDSLWIHCRNDAPLESFTRRTAVVSATGDLVGRVRSVYHLRGQLVRVQGLADPTFAVRFRVDEAWGFLMGTGTREGGRALLDVRHVVGALELEEGMSIFSDGDDAIFPGGVLLGKVVRTRGGDSGYEFQVLAESDPATLGSVIVLVDEAAGHASRIASEVDG